MADKIGCVILAAGEGTRMQIDGPKPLVSLSGRRLIDFPIALIQEFQNKTQQEVNLSVVTGFQKEKLEDHILKTFPKEEITFAHQEERKGTADALKTYFDKCPQACEMDYTLIVCADTPLLDYETLETLYHIIQKEGLEAVCATFETEHPSGYGRIVRSSKGFSIVEEKDADPEQKLIKEVNSGLYMMRTEYINQHLNQINNENASGEFYLTDLFTPERNVKPLAFQNQQTFLGVNTLEQLEAVERELRKKKIKKLRDQGVRFIDSRHCYLDDSVEVDPGCTIYPNAFLEGETIVKKGTVVGPGVIVSNCFIGESCELLAYSHLEKAHIDGSSTIGPFARLREGSHLEEKSKIGNFVETKKAKLGKETKINHLSYVGDAEIGERTNIGCGFITCNYDGKDKHLTKIGSDSFIGSDCQTIAPVEIGDDCFVGSGSTVNQNIEDGGFAIARCRQTTKAGMAKKFLKKKET